MPCCSRTIRALVLTFGASICRLISRFSIHGSQPNWALAYEFDIYLRGPGQTPFEEPR